jgi:hypothetical protein
LYCRRCGDVIISTSLQRRRRRLPCNGVSLSWADDHGFYNELLMAFQHLVV